MATYAQLESEQVWHDQVVPPFMTGFLIVPLRNHYSLGADAVGSPGDNGHLYGRHRSADWDRRSRYCTNRAYGTTDARDRAGSQSWYRAVDIGITGEELHAACHRLDNAVRAGLLPEVAEWFGTFDGKTVVGWFQGHPSSSDSSHLFHLHVGLWTQFANDFHVMQRVFDVVTGTAIPAPVPEEDDDMHLVGSGASDGSIYFVPGYAAPSGRAAAFGLGGDLFQAYKNAGVKLVTLPTGMRVVDCPVYDINPQPWPAGGSSGPAGPVDLTDAAVAQVAVAVADEDHRRSAS